MKQSAGMAAAFVVLICGTAAGCADSAKLTVPRTTPTGASTASQDPTRTAVLAAYSSMWSDYSKDLLTANWQNPVSANHATGQALLSLKNQLTEDSHHGWIGKGDPVLHPVVKSLTPGPPASAEVADCADFSRALTYVAATGALKDSTPGGWYLVDAGLTITDGVWKVSTLAMGQLNSC